MILCVMNPLMLGLNNILMPRMARAISAGEVDESRRVLRKATLVIGGATGALCAMVLLFGAQILRLLYGQAYVGQDATVAVLAIDMLVSSLSMAPVYGLWASEQSLTMFQIRVTRLVIAVAATLCLAGRLGPIAAAYGLLAGSIVGTVLTYWAHARLSAINSPTAKGGPRPDSLSIVTAEPGRFRPRLSRRKRGP